MVATINEKVSPCLVAEAIKEDWVRVNVNMHRIVTWNQLSALEESNYYHLGCTLKAEAVIEDTDLNDLVTQTIGNTQFDIVDTTLYPDMDDIRRAVDMDSEANGDDIELWRMLDVIHKDNLENFVIHNAILGGKIALMNSLEVDVDYRRLGAGTALLNHLKNYLEVLDVHSIALIPAPLGVDPVELTWKAKRDDLLEFYAANGFEIIPVDDEFIALYAF